MQNSQMRISGAEMIIEFAPDKPQMPTIRSLAIARFRTQGPIGPARSMTSSLATKHYCAAQTPAGQILGKIPG